MKGKSSGSPAAASSGGFGGSGSNEFGSPGGGKAKGSPRKRSPGRGPVALICHICGMKFGSASLKIHIPQCEKKWVDREAKKPKKERKPVPQPPKDIDNIKVGGGA